MVIKQQRARHDAMGASSGKVWLLRRSERVSLRSWGVSWAKRERKTLSAGKEVSVLVRSWWELVRSWWERGKTRAWGISGERGRWKAGGRRQGRIVQAPQTPGEELCINCNRAIGGHFNRARQKANKQMNNLSLIKTGLRGQASRSRRERGIG